MTDPVHFQIFLEMHGLLPINSKAVGKFDSIIGLNAFDRTREGFHQLFYKPGRRIGAMLLECLHETPAGVLVNSCILKKLFSDHLGVFQTGRRDRFHIDPNPLSGMIHLFIGLRDVLRILGMNSHDSLFPKETVKPGNEAGIAALAKFDPENNQTGMRIPASHIVYELAFHS